MALFDSFPYSNAHELNLDWIIETVRKYDNIIEEFQTFMNEWAGDKAELEAEMQRIENLLTATLAEFNSKFEIFTTNINAEMTNFKAVVTTELANQRVDYSEKIQALDDYTQAELAAYLNRYLADFEAFTQSVIVYCDNLHQSMDTSITALRDGYILGDKATLVYVDTKLQRFIDELENLYPPVYNPVKGYQTSLQQALDDLYSMFAYIDGWTARQWDNLSYTAGQLDALDLTAREHDTQAANLELRNKICDCVMYSPFNGELTLVSDVINEIVDTYRTNTLTAAQFDAKDLTASYLDGLDLTAHELDFDSAILVA